LVTRLLGVVEAGKPKRRSRLCGYSSHFCFNIGYFRIDL